MITETIIKLIMQTNRVDEVIASKQKKHITSTPNTRTKNSRKI
jgi:hypothetical protein